MTTIRILCGNCKFFEISNAQRRRSECGINSSIVYDKICLQGCWPTTKLNDQCGSFEKKEEV